jgi:hypothetical protein
MITRTNRFKQSQARNKFKSHLSNHISHFETRRKTRYQYILAAIRLNIHCSKQTFIRESLLICIHRNSDSFTKSHQIVQKKKIAANEKIYNQHVLEKKQFTNKRFIYIYYYLFFYKYKHDSIISWNQITKAIDLTRFLSHTSRFYHRISKKSRSWLRILFFKHNFHVNHFESILSRIYSRFFKRYRFFWFKNSWIFVEFV